MEQSALSQVGAHGGAVALVQAPGVSCCVFEFSPGFQEENTRQLCWLQIDHSQHMTSPTLPSLPDFIWSGCKEENCAMLEETMDTRLLVLVLLAELQSQSDGFFALQSVCAEMRSCSVANQSPAYASVLIDTRHPCLLYCWVGVCK